MMAAPRLLLTAAAIAIGATTAAQDRTRIDEFAVPATGQGLPIEQVPGSGAALPADAQAVARDIAVADPALADAAETPDIGQLSQGGSAEASAQLSEAKDSRDLATAGASSPDDSRPGAVARLQGEDRCDPQAAREQPDSCARILELRAAEFAAAEAPRLSAEQALLAARGESAESLAPTASGMRLRLAGGNDPDARSRQNQELAAIYLERPPAAVPTVPEGSMGADPGVVIPEQLIEIIDALQQGLAGQP